MYSKYIEHNLILIFYISIFIFSIEFYVINPDAGVDYHSYLSIINLIINDEYFKEFGFYFFVKTMYMFNFSPESMMLILRILVTFLLLRFFYFTSKKYKIYGLLFFMLLPNMYISILSSLQTMVAISIFIQIFIPWNNLDKNLISCKKFMFYSILSFSFHYFSVIYIILYLSYCYFYSWHKFMKILIVITILVLIHFLQLYLFDAFGAFGYLKYIQDNSILIGVKGIFIGAIFILIMIILSIITKDKKYSSLFFDFSLLLFIIISISLLLKIDKVGILRGYNYFVPIVWLGIIAITEKFRINILFRFLFIIMLALNFINTVYNLDEQALNLKGFDTWI